jgi:hypothetical protein
LKSKPLAPALESRGENNAPDTNDRDVHPVMLLAFNDKVRQALRFREEIISYAGAGVLPACEKGIDFTA